MVAVAPPTYSDGSNAQPVQETTRNGDPATKRLNHYELQDANTVTGKGWLQKLGALLVDYRKNRSSISQAGSKLACPTNASKRDDILRAFPAGYSLHMQIFTPAVTGATSTNRDSVTGWSVRTDPYLFGHPLSRHERYRSPNEFAPHLIWLEDVAAGRVKDPEGEGRKLCHCKPCQKLTKSGGTGSPRSAKKPSQTPGSQRKRALAHEDDEDELAATPGLSSKKGGKPVKKKQGRPAEDSEDQIEDDSLPSTQKKRGRPPKKKAPASEDETGGEGSTDELAGPPPKKRARKSAASLQMTSNDSAAAAPPAARKTKKSSASLVRTPDVLDMNQPIWQMLGLKDNNLFTTGDLAYVPVAVVRDQPLRLTKVSDEVLYNDTTDRDVIWWPAKIKTLIPATNDGERSWRYKVVLLPNNAEIDFVMPSGKQWAQAAPEFNERQVRPATYYVKNSDLLWLPKDAVSTLCTDSQDLYTAACEAVMLKGYKATELPTNKQWVFVWGPEVIRAGNAIRLRIPGTYWPEVMVINRIEIAEGQEPGHEEGQLFGTSFKCRRVNGRVTWTKEPNTVVNVPSPDIMGKFYWRMFKELECFGSWNRQEAFQPPKGWPADTETDQENDAGTENLESGTEDAQDEEEEEVDELADDVSGNDNAGDINSPDGSYVDANEEFLATQAPNGGTSDTVDPDAPFDDVPDNREDDESPYLPVIDLDSNRRIMVNLESKKATTNLLSLARYIVEKFNKLVPRGEPEVILRPFLRNKLRKDEIIVPSDIGLCYVAFDGNVRSVADKAPVTPGQDEEIVKLFRNAECAKVRLGGQRWYPAGTQKAEKPDDDEEEDD